MINNSIIYKFFKDGTNNRKRTNRVIVFRSRPFPNILKDWDHQWNLPRIWKTRLFQALIEEFSCMKESSGSKFFRITTGIQSGPSAFDKSKFIMTSLIILGVTEILCSFRLVWEGKTGKKVPESIPESSRLKFVEKFSANAFVFSDAEGNTFGPLNRERIADLPLLRTLGNSSKVPRAKFLRGHGLFCFISISKFGSFKNPFATITSLSELYLRIRRFFSLVQMKKVISMNYGSSTSS